MDFIQLIKKKSSIRIFSEDFLQRKKNRKHRYCDGRTHARWYGIRWLATRIRRVCLHSKNLYNCISISMLIRWPALCCVLDCFATIFCTNTSTRAHKNRMWSELCEYVHPFLVRDFVVWGRGRRMESETHTFRNGRRTPSADSADSVFATIAQEPKQRLHKNNNNDSDDKQENENRGTSNTNKNGNTCNEKGCEYVTRAPRQSNWHNTEEAVAVPRFTHKIDELTAAAAAVDVSPYSLYGRFLFLFFECVYARYHSSAVIRALPLICYAMPVCSSRSLFSRWWHGKCEREYCELCRWQNKISCDH